MTISKEERAELREIVASVTLPFPWEAVEATVLSGESDFIAECDEDDEECPEITTLIAAAVNAAPKLLAALDAADERIAGLEADSALWERRFADARREIEQIRDELKELEGADTALASLQKRIAELEAAAQWRPMATAPRDGTEILAWCLGQHYELVAWEEHSCHQWIGDASRYDEDQVCAWLPIPALPEGGAK